MWDGKEKWEGSIKNLLGNTNVMEKWRFTKSVCLHLIYM